MSPALEKCTLHGEIRTVFEAQKGGQNEDTEKGGVESHHTLLERVPKCGFSMLRFVTPPKNDGIVALFLPDPARESFKKGSPFWGPEAGT